MIEFRGFYYDGRTSKAHPVAISADEKTLVLRGEGIDLNIPLGTAEILIGVGTAKNIVRLGDRGEFHTDDSLALEQIALFSTRHTPERLARRLEQKVLFALGALVITILLVGAFLRYALPEMARYAAAALPPSVEARLGQETLATLEKFYLHPTTLSQRQQERIKSALDEACRYNDCPKVTLLFRDSKELGANAFALPDQTVVLTDDLVGKAHHNDEIVAVLLHELGHVRHDHIERMLLQSLGSGMILVMITGDIGNFSDLAAGLPAILLQQGYSRDMEDEADRFALDALHAAKIEPKRFADILLRITRDAPDHGTLFSSHPNTLERVRPFLETKKN